MFFIELAWAFFGLLLYTFIASASFRVFFKLHLSRCYKCSPDATRFHGLCDRDIGILAMSALWPIGMAMATGTAFGMWLEQRDERESRKVRKARTKMEIAELRKQEAEHLSSALMSQVAFDGIVQTSGIDQERSLSNAIQRETEKLERLNHQPF